MRSSLRFAFASGQIQGKRSAQEDTVDVLLQPDGAGGPGEHASVGVADTLVLVVADGMGGHVGGRVASGLVARRFLDAVGETSGAWAERLEAGMLRANEILAATTRDRPDLDGMGSTLVAAVVGENGVGWVSIGDSGLFLWSAGALQRLNEDHSFGAYLDAQAARGLITAEAAARDRRRNQLFHALMGDQIDHFERFGGFRALAPGDVVLMASDGLETLDEAEIAALIAAHRDDGAERLVERLLAAVERVGLERQDNASLVLVTVDNPDRPAPPPSESRTGGIRRWIGSIRGP